MNATQVQHPGQLALQAAQAFYLSTEGDGWEDLDPAEQRRWVAKTPLKFFVRADPTYRGRP
jgi:hypothetical protein